VRDGDRLVPTFSDVDDELQLSVGNEIRLCEGGATHRRVTWCSLGVVRSPMERW
jgi:hypothetical protein